MKTFVLISTLFATSICWSQPQQIIKPTNAPKIPVNNQAVLVKKADDPFYKFSFYSELSYTVQSEKLADGSRPESSGFYIMPKLNIGDYSVKGEFSYAYDLKNPSVGNDWDDGRVTFSRKSWELGDLIKLAPTLYFDLPLSKESRENRGIQLITNPGFLLSLNNKTTGWDNLTLTYAINYGFFTNQYTTKANGDVATKNRLTQVLTGRYKYKKFTFAEIFSFYSSYSYEDVVRNSFKHIDVINYSLTDTIELGIAHCNGPAPLLKANTYENNLRFYSQETSQYGISIGITI
ncbi:MAG: hypothetical protein WA160_01600 [Pseudobdellovibrio sp.]